jgi:hypothetical protein
MRLEGWNGVRARIHPSRRPREKRGLLAPTGKRPCHGAHPIRTLAHSSGKPVVRIGPCALGRGSLAAFPLETRAAMN